MTIMTDIPDAICEAHEPEKQGQCKKEKEHPDFCHFCNLVIPHRASVPFSVFVRMYLHTAAVHSSSNSVPVLPAPDPSA